METANKIELEVKLKVASDMLESESESVQRIQCDTTLWTAPFKCAVISCRNIFYNFDATDSTRYKFHSFPEDSELQKVWFEKCRLVEGFNPNSAKVCTDHFLSEDYENDYAGEIKNLNCKRKLKPLAIPSQLLDGPEINIVDLIEYEKDFVETKRMLDENLLLKQQIEKATREKSNLIKKTYNYEKKLLNRKQNIVRVSNQCEKLKAKSLNCKDQKNLLSKIFSESQINILLGRKKTIWSNDDMAMAFTLRHIGNRDCYLYLKQTLNIPLPALSAVQRWAAAKFD